MSRIQALNQRYATSAALLRRGVELVRVADPTGERLNAAAGRLLRAVRDDGPGLWDDLLGAVRLLRWRLVAQPQPSGLNGALRDGAEKVHSQVRRLRGAVVDDTLLDELTAAAQAVSESDSQLCGTLVSSMSELGTAGCVVIAANRSAQAALEDWLGSRGVAVLTVGALERERPRVSQAYAVGPPRIFQSSLVTAPTTSEVSFFMPGWYVDRSIPSSAIAPYAEGAIRVEARVFTLGDVAEPMTEIRETKVEDELLPQPVWGGRRSPDREPTSEEVEARMVLLSRNLAIWLDDGDRIRALDPDQPVGERVIYTEVDAVRAGTYLLLRQGETERGALCRAALGTLGSHAADVEATQRAWKQQLSRRLEQHGYRAVARELRSRGVKAADRARAWTDPNLVRPSGDHDFEVLLQWLGLPTQPSFSHATVLRRALYQASADVREQLETAVSAADLSLLERDGHLSLDVKTEGFRGIVATRVLAVSPYTEIVARHDARVPFEDRSAQWLE